MELWDTFGHFLISSLWFTLINKTQMEKAFLYIFLNILNAYIKNFSLF